MADKSVELGFPPNAGPDAHAAWASKIIGTEPLFKRLDPIPAPVSATVARLGARLDRLATWVLLGVRLEGVLRRLSSYPHRFVTPQPELGQSAAARKKAPSHNA